jgi:hypothetical protein
MKIMILHRYVIITSFIFLLVSSIVAQRPNSDRCRVVVVDANKKSEKEIGEFDTIVGEEERTIKDFVIPDTPYHVLASIFYTDESWDAGDSMFMELLISTGYNTDPLKALHVSTAELLIEEISAARVSVMFQLKNNPYVVILECKRKKEKAK